MIKKGSEITELFRNKIKVDLSGFPINVPWVMKDVFDYLKDKILVPEEKWQRIQTLIETLDEECSACDKPRRCWLGCKVNFSVVFLRNILGEELRKTLIKE